MDGIDPSGTQKVGLIDKHQIWAFMCDPFNHVWRARFGIQGNFSVHVREMINHFIPLDADGSDGTRLEVKTDFEVSS